MFGALIDLAWGGKPQAFVLWMAYKTSNEGIADDGMFLTTCYLVWMKGGAPPPLHDYHTKMKFDM